MSTVTASLPPWYSIHAVSHPVHNYKQGNCHYCIYVTFQNILHTKIKYKYVFICPLPFCTNVNILYLLLRNFFPLIHFEYLLNLAPNMCLAPLQETIRQLYKYSTSDFYHEIVSNHYQLDHISPYEQPCNWRGASLTKGQHQINHSCDQIYY